MLQLIKGLIATYQYNNFIRDIPNSS
uniref:Uncharacterized protein n=1 Tax=Anguilla anguilla TaxID=7936 RepID=A0A0E9SH98_ANGAN